MKKLLTRLLLAALLIFIVISFVTLPRDPLQNDDAALYALAAKNAVIHNMWLSQFFTPGDPSSFLDKPPLGIWLLAWPLKILGVSELTIHFSNVLYFVLLLGILYWSLAKLSGKKIAFNATLIAATSLCLVVYSRTPKLDVLLTLFVLTAHLSLYAFLKKGRTDALVPFALSLAAGFLVKSGFGLLLPALTFLFLFVFNSSARAKFLGLLTTYYSLLSAFIFLGLVGGVLCLQAIPLGSQFIPYLKSIFIQSKYNTGYVGLGFYHSVFSFLLITIFPWTPLAFSAFKARWHRLTLNTFCNVWFWSNILFLLFFYRQNDLRTFTILVPPLAILAGIRLLRLKRSAWIIGWQIFFVAVFSLLLFAGIINPVNQDGFSLVDAIIPVALFTIALFPLTAFFIKPTQSRFVVTYILVVLAYSVLFYNTKPIADAFNPDLKWPMIIKEYSNKGYSFFIYRPLDRQLFYSPDLFYVDFMAGPADKYFWDGAKLKQALIKEKAIVLSDTESWKKLGLKNSKLIAEDNYSRLISF